MANEANIKATITADDKASSVLRGFGDNVSSIGGKVAGIAEVAAKATLAMGAAAVAGATLAVRAYMETQDVQTQLTAALTSTHHVAGLFIEDLNDQSAALQRVTKFSDEQIGSAQALLLTFTSIHGAIYQQAIPAILDVATAMHEDLQSASVQVGKALNDPITGITALHRIGVTFSDTQKTQIQNFVDTNQLAKAQGVILEELSKEFGGSATAAGKTFGGQLAILKNQLNEVEEQVGHVIINALVPFATRALTAVQSVDWTTVINNTIDALRRFWAVVMQAWDALNKIYDRLVFVAQTLYAFFLPSLQALAETIQTRLMPPLIQLWNTLEPGLTTSLKIVAAIIGITVVAAIWLFINVLNITASVLGFVARAIADVIGWMGNVGGVAINAGRAIGGAFASAEAPIRAIADAIRDVINVAREAINAVSSIPNPVSGAKSLFSGITSHLPHFADGGTVPGNIGEPTLAVVHGGETVIPVGGGGNAGGGVINININAGAYMGSQIEARKYALMIAQALKDHADSKNITVGSLLGAT